ncbi:MAG: metallopeptidase family protein [Hyphomicrobiaceae bacterium]
MSSSPDWSTAMAPSLDDLERLAMAAWDRLPVEVRSTCGDVVIRIDEYATDEVLDSLGIDSPFELMGLYQGVSIDRRSTGDPPREPDMVFLYRRAILDYWAEAGDETLADLVAHVLVHEIGHHFGFSDADMEAIEAAATT